VATPPQTEVDQEPGRRSAQRISYLDAGGRPATRDTAEVAVIRDFDDRGNVISMMTERLSR
jgi:hypothetical protein